MEFDLQIEEVSQSQRIMHFVLANKVVQAELDKEYDKHPEEHSSQRIPPR